MRYVIAHETSLVFPSPIREHQCELRLTPRHDATQHVHAVHIDVETLLENPFDYTPLTPSQEHAWFAPMLATQPRLR